MYKTISQPKRLSGAARLAGCEETQQRGYPVTDFLALNDGQLQNTGAEVSFQTLLWRAAMETEPGPFLQVSQTRNARLTLVFRIYQSFPYLKAVPKIQLLIKCHSVSHYRCLFQYMPNHFWRSEREVKQF